MQAECGLAGIDRAIAALANKHDYFLVFDFVAARRLQHCPDFILLCGFLGFLRIVFGGKLEALGLRGARSHTEGEQNAADRT